MLRRATRDGATSSNITPSLIVLVRLRAVVGCVFTLGHAIDDAVLAIRAAIGGRGMSKLPGAILYARARRS